MAAFKNQDNGTWYVMFRYADWKGERKQKCKRGFATRQEALEWEREFLQQKRAECEIFKTFPGLTLTNKSSLRSCYQTVIIWLK